MSRTPHNFVPGEIPTATMFDGLAWGQVGYAELTADSNAFTSESVVQGSGGTLSVDVTHIASRWAKVVGHVEVSAGSATSESIILRIYKGAGIATGTLLKRDDVVLETAGRNATIHSEVRIQPSAGAVTYFLSAERTGDGHGTVLSASSNPAYIAVDDMGSTT